MQDHRPLLSPNSLSGVLGNSNMQIHTWEAAHSLAPRRPPPDDLRERFPLLSFAAQTKAAWQQI